MKSIQELMKEEEWILTKWQDGKYRKPSGLKEDIENLLDKISSSHNLIDTTRKLKWVCNAIIRWESFLTSEFGVCKTTPIPSTDSLPTFKDDEIEHAQLVALQEVEKKTLEQLIKQASAKQLDAIEKLHEEQVAHDKKVEEEHKYLLLTASGKPYRQQQSRVVGAGSAEIIDIWPKVS